MHASYSFLAHPSVRASHCIPAFHLGHVHLFNYASSVDHACQLFHARLAVLLVILFMHACYSVPACCVLCTNCLFHPCHLIFAYHLVCTRVSFHVSCLVCVCHFVCTCHLVCA